MAIVVCQLAARRRIQGRDTGAYTPAQKGPTIIVLVKFAFFSSQNHIPPSQPETQTTTSELGKCREFCGSKLSLTRSSTRLQHMGSSLPSVVSHWFWGNPARLGFVSKYKIKSNYIVAQLTHSAGRNSAVL